jgi:hypothetical protein
MKHHNTLTHHTPAPSQLLRTPSFGIRWLRYFFPNEDELSHQHHFIDLQRRAIWIGCALLLQSLAEFLQFPKSDYLNQVPSSIVILLEIFSCILTLGSFFALWRALCPGETLLQREKQRFSYYWQRLLLISLFLLSVIGSIIGISTIIQCFQAP